MHRIFQLILGVLFVGTLLQAAPARNGVKTFTQPDGSTFQGILKGDSSFHWIESENKVVLFNAKDKFYYNASFDKTGNVKLVSKRLESSKRMRKAPLSAQAHSVSSNMKGLIHQLYIESKRTPHPK